jgi:sterol 3beta-glucosyltransferase
VRHAGCGLQIHGLTEKEFEAALRKGSSDRIMIERAQAMGEQIRKENGVRAALDFV